ncbi:hypothetical protein RB593_002478 [Gaeumannomyces tritici]
MYIPYPSSGRDAEEPVPVAIETPAWLRGAVSSIANTLWASFAASSSPFSSFLPSSAISQPQPPPPPHGLRRRQDPGQLSVNAMVGIVVGILLVAFIILVFWFLYYFRPLNRRRKYHHRRHRHRKSTGSSTDAAAVPADPPPA